MFFPGDLYCFFFLYFWLLTVSWFSFNTWLNSAAGIKWDRSKRRIRGSMFTSKPCSSIISALKTDCWRSWRNIKRLIEDEGWCKDSKSYITFSFSILLQIRKLLIFLVQISNFPARIFLSLINRWHLNFAFYLQTFNLNILKHRIFTFIENKWSITTCSFLSFCFSVLWASDLSILKLISISVSSSLDRFLQTFGYSGRKGIHLLGWMNNYWSSIGELSGLSIIESASFSPHLKYLSYWLSLVLI